MVFVRHSKVGLLALALSAVSIANGFSLPGNEDNNSDQPNTPRIPTAPTISPDDIFGFVDGTRRPRNPQVSPEMLMRASYDYFQTKIRAYQNNFPKLSNNILGLAALLQNHPQCNLPEMDSMASARYVMGLLKGVIDKEIPDKNKHYARVHYGELLLRRVKNEMTDEEKAFAGEVLSQFNKHYTQAGTLYYVELILHHHFLPEGVFTHQIAQYCENLLKSTYSNKRPRTGEESRAVTRLITEARTQTQSTSAAHPTEETQTLPEIDAQTEDHQPTGETQTLPEIDPQPKILTESEVIALRKRLEKEVADLKAQTVREQAVESNSNLLLLSVPTIGQEGSAEQNFGNVSLVPPLLGKRNHDEIDDAATGWEPAASFDNSNSIGASNTSSSPDAEMPDATGPQDTPMRDEDASSSSSSDDDSDNDDSSSSSSSDDSDSDDDDDSTSTNQSATRRYLARYTDKQIQKVINNIGDSKTFQNIEADRPKIWDVLTKEQRAHFANNPNSERFRDHVRHYWIKILRNKGVEVNQKVHKVNKEPLSKEQIESIIDAIKPSKILENNEEGRLIIWREMTEGQRRHFGNPDSNEFKVHVRMVLSKKLSKFGIEVKTPSYFFNQIYTDNQVQRILNNIRKEPFRNNATGREKIWREMTPEQKERFGNDSNSRTFKSHVNRTWSKHGIELQDAQSVSREPYTDDQLKNIASLFKESKVFENNKEDRLKIWEKLTPNQQKYFGNPNDPKFSRHVAGVLPKILSKELSKEGIEFEDAHSILRVPYTENQIKAVVDVFSTSNTFQNTKEDRLKIWRKMTPEQRAHFDNDPNSKPFVRHVHGVWAKKLAKHGIKFISQSSSNNNNN